MNVPLGYLRNFVTFLVVVHHAVLAYVPLAPEQATSLTALPRTWQAFPIVDSPRVPALQILVAFDDISMMALMFFLSGLFVWSGLGRRGPRAYLASRTMRLGVPFLVSALVFSPAAYYATYLRTPGASGFGGFVGEWLQLGTWPAGPAWFIWMLLAFDAVVVASSVAAPRLWPWLARMWSRAAGRPAVLVLALMALSVAAYAPLRAIYGPFRWFAFGPIYGQTSRVLLYFVYFAWGIVAGMQPDVSTTFSSESGLARTHGRWIVAAILMFGVSVPTFVAASQDPSSAASWLSGVLFPVCGLTCSLAVLGLFLKRVSTRRPLLDAFGTAAYGIYLVHYPFVTFLQLALAATALPPLCKAAIVSVLAVGASWLTVALFQKLTRRSERDLPRERGPGRL